MKIIKVEEIEDLPFETKVKVRGTLTVIQDVKENRQDFVLTGETNEIWGTLFNTPWLESRYKGYETVITGFVREGVKQEKRLGANSFRLINTPEILSIRKKKREENKKVPKAIMKKAIKEIEDMTKEKNYTSADKVQLIIALYTHIREDLLMRE